MDQEQEHSPNRTEAYETIANKNTGKGRIFSEKGEQAFAAFKSVLSEHARRCREKEGTVTEESVDGSGSQKMGYLVVSKENINKLFAEVCTSSAISCYDQVELIDELFAKFCTSFVISCYDQMELAVEKTYEIVTTMCQTSTTKNIVAGIPSEHSRTGTLMTEYNTLSEKTFISYIKMLGKVGAVSDYIEDIYQFIDKYENIRFGHAEQTVVDHVKEICKRCVVAGCLKSVNMFEAIFNKSVLGERPSYDLFRIKGFTCSFRQKNNFTIEIELDIPENFHLDRFSTSGKEYKRDIANYYTLLDEQFEKASTTEPKIHNYILGMCKCLRIRLSETIGPFAAPSSASDDGGESKKKTSFIEDLKYIQHLVNALVKDDFDRFG